MSTTVVTRGKLEVYDREQKPLPPAWAVDKSGRAATDAERILEDMLHRVGGGILPLGGEGELYGGYKGYGLAVMVDILCAVLCGGVFGPEVFDTEVSSARVSHFFGAISIDRFRDPAAFRSDMDKMIRQLRNTSRAEGAERVWVAGEKEFEHHQRAEKEGIFMSDATIAELKKLATEFQVAFL